MKVPKMWQFFCVFVSIYMCLHTCAILRLRATYPLTRIPVCIGDQENQCVVFSRAPRVFRPPVLVPGRSLHIQNYAHAQPKHPHKKRAQHTRHTGSHARAPCGALAHLRRRRERRAARAQGRDGQAEGALKVALPAKLLHEPVGPAPRRGEGAARVGDVGGVDDVGAELVQGRRVGCPRGGGRPVRVDGCLAMVRAICF